MVSPNSPLKLLIGIVALLFCLGGEVLGENPKQLKGVALVIGQSKYEHLTPLANPANDAQSIAKLLGEQGFNVTAITDRDARKLRRDLENFAADAEGADVAAVYYSGHGIEAGGENWLVPIDADVASLATAEKSLVPLSTLLDQLRIHVPLTLLFLDACRSNPFPPGAALNKDGTLAPLTTAGLGRGKGFVEVSAGETTEGLGAVVAFAAEPGQIALDGPPDGNSPYAAAILRHLQASSGAEFGTVMRMVTEEVYLKTQGQQRPWVNETLTRLLYFGGKPVNPDTDDGRLDGGRRALLITIAALPNGARKSVEQIAMENGLPLDPLYGMLNQLKIDAAASPDVLDRQLRAGVDMLKKLLEKRDTVTRTDPEIIRYTELADRAQADGVISLAQEYRAKASARAAEISAALGREEADIRARHLEVAATYAKEAETAVLAFDQMSAAQLYHRASVEVEKWDAAKAFEYGAAEAAALTYHGDLQGDNDVLRRSITLHRKMLSAIDRAERPEDWAMLQSNLGNALQTLGTRDKETFLLREAVEAYRAALEVRKRAQYPTEWARTQNNLAAVLWVIGTREDNAELLEEAATAFRSTLEVRTQARHPTSWATTHNNLGGVLWALAERNGNTEQLEETIAAFNAALLVRTRTNAPLGWAKIQNNRGIVFQTLGERTNQDRYFDAAAEAFRMAIEERTRERAPLDWAATQNNLGITLQAIGNRKGENAYFEAAIASYRAALLERTRARSPLDYAMTKANLAEALLALGQRAKRLDMLKEAEQCTRDAWSIYQTTGSTYDDYFTSRLSAIAEAIDGLR